MAPIKNYKNLHKSGLKDHAPLRLYLTYRLILATGLSLVFLSVEKGLLGWFMPTTFQITSHLYILLTLMSVIYQFKKPDSAREQCFAAMLIDIACITVMMHASGGIQSGLGVMYAITIALGSMSISGRAAIIYAGYASFAILLERLFSLYTNAFHLTNYTHAILLSASLFALAFLAQQLSIRSKESQRLADDRADELANMAKLNELIIQKMRTGILLIDDDEKIQLMNRSARKLLELPKNHKMMSLKEANSDLHSYFQQWQKQKNKHDKNEDTERFRTSFTSLGSNGDFGTLIFIDDSAHLKARAQEMKMASLGKLTSGIAHEIRNPLGAISHAAQLLNEDSEDFSGGEKRMSEIIQNNCLRVNQTIENVLNLARKNTPNRALIKLSPWLKSQITEISLLHHLQDGQIELRSVIGESQVLIDSAQFRQVIDVLCENSVVHFDKPIEALKITIQLHEDDSGIWVHCCDNGKGIEKEQIQHIFEPFYTTRNQGTGLGLYIAYQLCEINEIRVSYSKNPDLGGCFKMHIPELADN